MNDGRGYIEIEFAGEKRPMKFGWAFLAKLCKKFNLKLTEIEQVANNIDIEQMLWFIYFGLKEGERVSGKKLPKTFSLETVGDWLDTAEPTTLKEVFETFASSFTVLPPKTQEQNPK